MLENLFFFAQIPEASKIKSKNFLCCEAVLSSQDHVIVAKEFEEEEKSFFAIPRLLCLEIAGPDCARYFSPICQSRIFCNISVGPVTKGERSFHQSWELTK